MFDDYFKLAEMVHFEFTDEYPPIGEQHYDPIKVIAKTDIKGGIILCRGWTAVINSKKVMNKDMPGYKTSLLFSSEARFIIQVNAPLPCAYLAGQP